MDTTISSTEVASTKKPMFFMTLDAFKQRLGLPLVVGNVKIVHNPTTEKVFAQTSLGQCFKAQQNLNVAKPIKFMYETEDLFLEGCIINATELNVIATI